MKMIVGLGNVGKEYEMTYHNVGFMVIDSFAKNHSADKWKTKGKSMITTLCISGQKVVLVKPTTYMNLSGQSVREVQKHYGIDSADIIILLDDIDLLPGAVRYREGGSGGTHNGLKSVIECVGQTPRIRVGVGRDERMDLADYVLSKISLENRVSIEDAISLAVAKLDEIVGA